MSPIKEIDVALGLVVVMQGPQAGSVGLIVNVWKENNDETK